MMEIRWHGRGGQGVVTAAAILARSSMAEGKFFQAYPEFGAERTGAPLVAFTRIADHPIRTHNPVEHPKVVVVIDQILATLPYVLEGIEGEGMVVVNYPTHPDRYKKIMKTEKLRACTLDATKVALEDIRGREVSSRVSAVFTNMPMLGATVRATQLVRLESVLEEVRRHFGGRYSSKSAEINVNAVKRGYEEVLVE